MDSQGSTLEQIQKDMTAAMKARGNSAADAVHRFASELAKTAGFESHSSLEWADCITQEVDAVLSALKRLRP